MLQNAFPLTCLWTSLIGVAMFVGEGLSSLSFLTMVQTAPLWETRIMIFLACTVQCLWRTRGGNASCSFRMQPC